MTKKQNQQNLTIKHGDDVVGGSRAAKKRAKLKDKKRKVQEDEHHSREPNAGATTNCVVPSNTKKNRLYRSVDKVQKCILRESINFDKDVMDKDIGIDMHNFYPTVLQILSEEEKPPSSASNSSDSNAAVPIKNIKSEDLTAKQRAHMILQSLLYPAGVTVKQFYLKFWEKEPLYISASSDDDNTETQGKWTTGRSRHPTTDRFKGIFSSQDMKHMLKNQALLYKYDLNVTKCNDKKERINFDSNVSAVNMKKKSAAETDQNSPQVADVQVVWDNLENNGCTVRFLCPHKHHDTLHKLLSILESEFGCMVGCNAYLTPGYASQGFAPHYDDIEAFILQIEGKKRWRVYPPLNGKETLPRTSSDDFVMVDANNSDSDKDDSEDMRRPIKLIKSNKADGRREVPDDPVLDIVLEPGDMLYLPRGWIHQGITQEREKEPSLHLTVSCMQQWAWADLMEIIIPEATKSAIESESYTTLREGLPRNFLSYMGVMNEETENIEGLKQAVHHIAVTDGSEEDEERKKEEQKMTLRKAFIERAKTCLQKVFHEVRKLVFLEMFFKVRLCPRSVFFHVDLNHVCVQALQMIDAGCDEIGKTFLANRQPPALFSNEMASLKDSKSRNFKITPTCMVRLVRDGIARLTVEDDKAVLYHCADNSREFQGNPLQPLEFELDDAPALEMLLKTTSPHWICVADLVMDDIEDKVEIVQSLFDEGIISVFQP